MTMRGGILVAVFGLLVGFAAPAGAEAPAPTPPANDDCLMCHGDKDAKRADNSSVAISPEKFAASMHGAILACVDCHQDLATATEFPHSEKLARVNCATCHDAAAAKYEHGIHGQTRKKGGAASEAASCADCHGTHDIRPSKDPESLVYHLNLPATCGKCHGNADIIKRGGIAIGDVYAQYRDSIHGRALTRSGLMVSAACIDCHGNHDIQPKNNPASSVFRSRIPATCGKCHEGIQTQYELSVHGLSSKAGNSRAAVCTDCHTAHQIVRIDLDSWKLGVIRECGTCHEQSILTYRDTYHGQVSRLGFVRVATCAECHGAHNIYTVADPRSMVSTARVVSTCQKCHPGANANFARYDPHANKHNRDRNPMLFFTAQFMKYLLGGVFLFFGIHTLLWIPRSVRERRSAPREH